MDNPVIPIVITPVRLKPAITPLGALGVAIGLALAFGAAFYFSDYHLFQLTMVVVYAIAILGLSIVTGFNGQISLGHGAFYAIGAYVTAILMDRYDVPYFWTLPVSAVVCAGVGFLIGFPGLAPWRAIPGADDFRAGGRHPAAAEAQVDRGIHWRRAGHCDPEARSAVPPADQPRPVANICLRWASAA